MPLLEVLWRQWPSSIDPTYNKKTAHNTFPRKDQKFSIWKSQATGERRRVGLLICVERRSDGLVNFWDLLNESKYPKSSNDKSCHNTVDFNSCSENHDM